MFYTIYAQTILGGAEKRLKKIDSSGPQHEWGWSSA